MSPFTRLQSDVTQCLLSHDELRYVTITQVRPRAVSEAAGIVSNLDKVLAGTSERNGKRGVACIVGMPVCDGVKANVRRLRGRMLIAIDVIETIVHNNTGADCETHAWTVAGILQHMSFAPFAPLVAEPQMMTPRPEAVLNKQVIYRIEMSVDISGDERPKVATPEIATLGDQITLSCATDGAALWWTLDGGYPGPGGQANLYTGPISVEPGQHTLRVAAHLSGYVASDAMAAAITIQP